MTTRLCSILNRVIKETMPNYPRGLREADLVLDRRRISTAGPVMNK